MVIWIQARVAMMAIPRTAMDVPAPVKKKQDAATDSHALRKNVETEACSAVQEKFAITPPVFAKT